jgi:hypothetical protein
MDHEQLLEEEAATLLDWQLAVSAWSRRGGDASAPGEDHSGNGINPHPACTASTDTKLGAELLALHTRHRPLDGNSHPKV